MEPDQPKEGHLCMEFFLWIPKQQDARHTILVWEIRGSFFTSCPLSVIDLLRLATGDSPQVRDGIIIIWERHRQHSPSGFLEFAAGSPLPTFPRLLLWQLKQPPPSPPNQFHQVTNLPTNTLRRFAFRLPDWLRRGRQDNSCSARAGLVVESFG